MNHSPRTSALLALCVYLLALLVRVWGIDQAAIVTDERFWVSRSVRVNHHLTTTPQHATTHLGHPGIPAAITMAFGMRVAGVLNRWHAVTILDPGFIDELDAAPLRECGRERSDRGRFFFGDYLVLCHSVLRLSWHYCAVSIRISSRQRAWRISMVSWW
jgi:hypothetical protein